MKKITSICAMVIFMVSVIAIGSAWADDAVPISAEEAFDAVVNQVDPNTGVSADVILVDIRTTAEFYWVGTCAKVDATTTTSGEGIIPDNGKVTLEAGAEVLKFEVEGGSPGALHVKHVDNIETSRIAINIPYKTWNDKKCEKVDNKKFGSEIEALAEDYDVIILMCRSGKRTSEAVEVDEDGNLLSPFNAFVKVYEVD